MRGGWVAAMGMMVGACAADEPLTDGMCTSYTRIQHASGVVEEWVDVLPGHIVVRKVSEATGSGGEWLLTSDHRFTYDDDGNLVQEHREVRDVDPERDRDIFEVHEHDDAGRRIRTVSAEDGEAWQEQTLSYDDDGQLLRVDIDYLKGWQDAWQETRWEDGRVVEWSSWKEGADLPQEQIRTTYLCSAPCLDADVEVDRGGVLFMRFTVRYEDGLLVSRDHQATEFVSALSTTYRYDDDERMVSMLHVDPDGGTRLTTWGYDAAGRQHSMRYGPDEDGDHVLDSVDDEQLWVWRCR